MDYSPIKSSSSISARHPGVRTIQTDRLSSHSGINHRPSTMPSSQMDTQTCSLLGPFAIAIQALMALIVLASLLFKRHREKPKRKLRIWTADVSKQVIGQAFVHMLNIWISASIAALPSKGNACAVYFMNIFIDTTIGVFVLYLSLKFVTKLVTSALGGTPTSLGLCSGIYPAPFFLSWLKQLAIYLTAMVILKILVLWVFWIGGEALVRFGDGVINAISSNYKVQIVIVVMIGPTCLNVLQFLLIDSFIKHQPLVRAGRPSVSDSGLDAHHHPHTDNSEPDSSTRFLSDQPDLNSFESDEDTSYQSNLPKHKTLTEQTFSSSHHEPPSLQATLLRPNTPLLQVTPSRPACPFLGDQNHLYPPHPTTTETSEGPGVDQSLCSTLPFDHFAQKSTKELKLSLQKDHHFEKARWPSDTGLSSILGGSTSKRRSELSENLISSLSPTRSCDTACAVEMNSVLMSETEQSGVPTTRFLF